MQQRFGQIRTTQLEMFTKLWYNKDTRGGVASINTAKEIA